MSTPAIRDFRPFLHYTPEKGWINDPNGLIYENGLYHLFCQHYPDEGIWGPMHWCHAVSRDLLHWERMPIALYPEEDALAFSGSAILDSENRSGLCACGSPILLIYTAHGKEERQALAFSSDGVRFQPYAANPVIPNPGEKDFRDPKVFWDAERKRYTACVASGDHIRFYASENLTAWRETGRFGASENRLGGVFECPDLFPLAKPDGGVCWALLASMSLPAVHGGSRTQYWLGDFDGNAFRATVPFARPEMLDSGRDNYAAVSFSGLADADRTLMSWANCWSYAAKEPTGDWCGQTTFARRVRLENTPEGLRLAYSPVVPEHLLAPVANASDAELPGELFHIRVESKGPFWAELRNDGGERFGFGLDGENRWVTDRTRSGETGFSPLFARGVYGVSIEPRRATGLATFDLYFDRCISEMFADGGLYANTTLVYPKSPYTRLCVTGDAAVSLGETPL